MITVKDVPQVPEGRTFRVIKVEKVSMPHPYWITPKHVEVASNYHGGMLTERTIEDAEKRGAGCDICRVNGMTLTYKEHENLVTLFVGVPQNRDLNSIEGLREYLLMVKGANVGIDGFAFPVVK